MKIVLGADHAGYAAKEELKKWLQSKGHDVSDVGTISEESTDYPDYAVQLCRSIETGEREIGILVCGTGIGMSIAANKCRGIRAAVCHDEFTAEMARAHNHANVLCCGARVLSQEGIQNVVDKFLTSGEMTGNHERRIGKVMRLEEKWCLD